jgi:formylmethanofuran dehydrogenase subunit D
MASISGMLITVRTSRQGAAMEKGKFTPEYLEETAMLSLCPADFQAVGLTPGQHARLISDDGEAVVTCRSAEGPKGVFFMPLGPTANLLIGGETQGTGVPHYKGITVTVKPEPDACTQADARKDVHS